MVQSIHEAAAGARLKHIAGSQTARFQEAAES
jgi:hypothetical protein